MSGMKTPSPPQTNQKIIGSHPVTSVRNGMHRWVITHKRAAADTNIVADSSDFNGFNITSLLIFLSLLLNKLPLQTASSLPD